MAVRAIANRSLRRWAGVRAVIGCGAGLLLVGGAPAAATEAVLAAATPIPSAEAVLTFVLMMALSRPKR